MSAVIRLTCDTPDCGRWADVAARNTVTGIGKAVAHGWAVASTGRLSCPEHAGGVTAAHEDLTERSLSVSCDDGDHLVCHFDACGCSCHRPAAARRRPIAAGAPW